MALDIEIPETCEENATLQTKILLAMAELLGVTVSEINSQGS